MMRRFHVPALVLALLAGPPIVHARGASPGTESDASGPERPAWELSASAAFYALPDEQDLLLPVLYADRGPLHLEARYNYENRDAGSLFAGWTFEHGDRFRVEATLMAGAVVGSLDGIAPGFELTLGYERLQWYVEGEYVFDLADSESNFFYSWSELSYSPLDWLRVGLTAQRLRVVRTDRELDWGLHLGGSVGDVSITAHVMNPEEGSRYFVLAVGADF